MRKKGALRRSPPPPGAPGRSEAGIALVLAVWALAILAVIVAEIVFTSRLRVKADASLRTEVQSYGLALAAYHAALDALGEDLTGVSRAEDGRLLLHRGPQDPGEPAEALDVPLGGGTYSYILDDEDGRVDINRQPRPVLVALLGRTGLEPGAERDALVNSILDWRDPDGAHRLGGAEEDYYRSLEEEYSCKDGPMDLIEELLLVKGMLPQYFYGGTVKGREYAPLAELVTVQPVTFNPATAKEAVLEIMGRARPAGRGAARPSRFYSIAASGRAEGAGAKRRIRAVVSRERRGSKILFHLLYWNDNHFPHRSQHGADEMQHRDTP